MKLSLFIEDPREGFPAQVLVTAVAKAKAKPDLKRISPTPAGDPTDVDGSDTSEPIVLRNEHDTRDKDANHHEADQREFERFVIKEVCGVTDQTTVQNESPVSITKPIDSGTTTKDRVSNRSFGTQTDESSFSENVSTRTFTCRRACCSDSSTNTGDDKNNPNTQDKDQLGAATRTDHPSPVKGGKVSTCDREGNSPTRTRCSLRSDSVHSEKSILEYIDSEYESLKSMNRGKNVTPRNTRAKSDHDRRINDLEEKYESVVKRLAFVEKDHTREICELKAEQRRLAYLGVGTTDSCSPRRKRFRRHSSDGSVSVDGCQSQQKDCAVDFDPTDDDSVWDVSECDVIVNTQDSQGNRVATRATPLHLKEMRKADNSARVSNTNVVTRAMSQSKPQSRPDARIDSRSGGVLDNRYADGMEAEPTPSTSTAVGLYKSTQFVDGMEDMPPPKASSDKQSGTRTRSNGYGAQGNRPRQSSPPAKQHQGKQNSIGARQPNTNKNKVPNAPSSGDRRPDKQSTNERSKPINNPPPKPSRNAPEMDSGSGAQTNSAGMSEGDKGEKDLFTLVVTRNGWSKGIGNGNDKGNKKPLKPICGLVDSDTKEMFVKGLKCAGFRTRNELEESIKAYVEEKGIFLIHHRVLSFKSSRTTVGCKMIVSNEDVDKISSKGFWPPGIWIREWFDFPSDDEHNPGNDKNSDESN